MSARPEEARGGAGAPGAGGGPAAPVESPAGDPFLLLGDLGRRSFDSVAIERELRALWKSPPDGGVFYRAALANLVVPLDAASFDRYSPVIGEVARRHPARLFRVQPETTAPADPARLSARATALCHLRRGGGGFVCSEMIVLEWTERTGPLVPSAVGSLLIGDLPVILLRLSCGAEPPWTPALAARADLVITDSGEEEEPAALPATWERAGRHGEPARDLAWARLEPWRGVIAEIFDRPDAAAALPGLEDVTIAHGGAAPPSGAWLLAGWLASRLSWRLEKREGARWRFQGARKPAVIAFARDEGEPESAILSVRLRAAGDRPKDVRIARRGRTGVARVEEFAPASAARDVPFPHRDLAPAIVGEIQRREPNPTFRAAAAAARAMVEAPA